MARTLEQAKADERATHPTYPTLHSEMVTRETEGETITEIAQREIELSPEETPDAYEAMVVDRAQMQVAEEERQERAAVEAAAVERDAATIRDVLARIERGETLPEEAQREFQAAVGRRALRDMGVPRGPDDPR